MFFAVFFFFFFFFFFNGKPKGNLRETLKIKPFHDQKAGRTRGKSLSAGTTLATQAANKQMPQTIRCQRKAKLMQCGGYIVAFYISSQKRTDRNMNDELTWPGQNTAALPTSAAIFDLPS